MVSEPLPTPQPDAALDDQHCIALLRNIEIFHDLPEPVLAWFVAHAECGSVPSGELVWHQESTQPYLYVILEGNVEVSRLQDGVKNVIMNYSAGAITGYLPYSRMRVAGANGVALSPVKYLSLHRDHFRELESQSYDLMQRLVGLMTDRVRVFTTTVAQQEKLLSLGKLSATLAHEMNNPASAIVRAAAQLSQRFQQQPAQYRETMARRYTPEQVDAFAAVYAKAMDRCNEDVRYSLMERNALVQEMEDWMDDHGIPDGYELVDALVDGGVQTADLAPLTDLLTDEELPPALRWLENVLAAAHLLYDIEEAAQRISELVNSVKLYTHMDQEANMVPVDFKAGLKATLILLAGKIKNRRASIDFEVAPNLPTILGNPGPLNQVWTNLIDNALDAIPDDGTGKVRVHVHPTQSVVEVLIADNGTGIPAEVQGRMFDAFFTTKPAGQGTGLGLDVAKRILQGHSATILVESEPGKTEFRIQFPVRKL